MKKLFSFFSIVVLACGYMFADDYVVIAKDGNVYDDANTKYITVNQNNDNVTVIPGMVFAASQHLPGWYKVEYSPGLHAFVPEQITTGNFKSVSPGSYNIFNNKDKTLIAENNGDDWSAKVDGNIYKGSKFQEIIIFKDNSNNVAFSLVDIGNGPIAIDYNNTVTKFF